MGRSFSMARSLAEPAPVPLEDRDLLRPPGPVEGGQRQAHAHREDDLVALARADLELGLRVLAAEPGVLRARGGAPREAAHDADVAAIAAPDLVRAPARELVRVLGIAEELAAEPGDVELPCPDVRVRLHGFVLRRDDDRDLERRLELTRAARDVLGAVRAAD